jgi:hypothetical protein
VEVEEGNDLASDIQHRAYWMDKDLRRGVSGEEERAREEDPEFLLVDELRDGGAKDFQGLCHGFL